MATATSCAHCHTMNLDSTRYCAGCGHEAHVPRNQCQCPRCIPVESSVEQFNDLTDLTDLLSMLAAGQLIVEDLE